MNIRLIPIHHYAPPDDSALIKVWVKIRKTVVYFLLTAFFVYFGQGMFHSGKRAGYQEGLHDCSKKEKVKKHGRK